MDEYDDSWLSDLPARPSRRRPLLMAFVGILGVALILGALFLWPGPARRWWVAWRASVTSAPTVATGPTPAASVVAPTPTATPSPVTPTLVAAQMSVTMPIAPATAVVLPISPTVAINYAFQQTTVYTFAASDPPAKTAELLTGLGLPALEQEVGVGVTGPPLTQTLSALTDLNEIAGAVYDPTLARLLLIGEYNPALPALDPADLLVALRAIYSGQEDVGVSIDPIDPNVLDGPMQVSYYGDTQNTHFGLVMYEADRHLKVLSMGQDNLTRLPATSAVPGYRSELDWMLALGDDTQSVRQWHRMWYMVQGGELAIRVSDDGNTMLFDQAPLVVEARFVEFDAQGQKHDVPGSDPVVDAFVSHFNQHFAEFAAEKPAVGQLLQLTKLLAIARWLYANQAPIDLAWLGAYSSDRVETPSTTSGQLVSKTEETRSGDQILQHTATIFGGVDFQFRLKASQGAPGDDVQWLGASLRQLLLDQRELVSVPIANKQYQVGTLPLRQMPRHGNFTQVHNLVAAPVNSKLPLKLDLYYDSFRLTSSPLSPGWSLEMRWVEFPGRPTRYTIDEQPVDLYDTLVVANHKGGKRWLYRNTQQIIKDSAGDRVVYQRLGNEGPTALYYDYRTGQFSFVEDGIDYTFANNGYLQAQSAGAERIKIQRDATGHPIQIQHTNGSQIDLTYEQGRLTQLSGPDGPIKLQYTDSQLTALERPTGNMEIAYQNGYPTQLRDGQTVMQMGFDDWGRVTHRQSGRLNRTFIYGSNGESVETITGLPDRLVTIERARPGYISRVIIDTTVRTADLGQVREVLADADLETGCLLQTLLTDPQFDLAPLTAGQFNQIVVTAQGGERVVRIEGNALVIDGRLRLDQLQQALNDRLAVLNELSQQGYNHLTLDPESGAVAGLNPTSGDLRLLVTQLTGTAIDRIYPQFPLQPSDLPHFLTDVAAQARGLRVLGIFQTGTGTWQQLTPSGDLQSILVDQPTALDQLNRQTDRAERRLTADQLADPIGDLLADPLAIDWAVTPGVELNIADLVLAAYPAVRDLYPEGVPGELLDQVRAWVQPAAQSVRLRPLRSPFGWLLPGSEPLFLDVAANSSLGFLLGRHLMANDVRLIAPDSTPLRAQAYLRNEKPMTAQQMVVVFTPHSQADAITAQAQRAAFAPIQARLAQLGVRVIDIGDNPSGHEQLLAELASEDLVIFDILHTDISGRLQVYHDGSLHPTQVQKARGIKHFMSCCSLRNGWTAKAVSGGADAATGTLEPISMDEVNAFLSHVADYLQAHPDGALPAQMEQDIRRRQLRQNGGIHKTPTALPMSREPNVHAGM